METSSPTSRRSILTMALGRSIEEWRKARNLKPQQLAALAGMDVRTLRALETRDSEKTSFDTAIAHAMGLSVEQLKAGPHSGGSAHEPSRSYDVPQKAGFAGRRRIKVAEQVRALEGGRLRPVDTPAAELGFVEVVSADSDMTALRVRGDALSPAVEDGELLIVRRGAGCGPGSKVLITLHSGERLCKRLLFERSDAITVADLANRAQSTIERKDMTGMEPIIAIYSADSWRSS